MTLRQPQKIRYDEMENKQSFIFKRILAGQGTYSTQEHMYVCDEESQWVPIMMQFAAFLEGAGYVGVVDRIETLVWD